MYKKLLIYPVSFLLLLACSKETNTITNDDSNTTEELPVAVKDEYYVQKNETLRISDLLNNDTIFDYGRISSIDNTSTEGGTISAQGNNTYIYTPASNFTGVDSFKYTLCDAKIPANCSEGTVSINVLEEVINFKAVNDALFIEKNSGTNTITTLLDNDFIANSEGIESINTDNTNGQAVLNDDGTVNYTPAVDFTGTDSFKYTICTTGTIDDCDTATVILTIADKVTFNIPNDLKNYYSTATFTTDSNDLKSQLTSLTANKHTNILFYSGRHSYLLKADQDPENSSNVILMYTGESKNKSFRQTTGASAGKFNTEHVYPQSLYNGGTGGEDRDEIVKGDLHHLRYCDSSVNTSRSNDKFTDGSGDAGAVGSAWYPGDEWKGDVARMIFYLNIRYGETITKVGDLDTFLEWNKEDPISNFEIQRNTVISDAQGNRNPFIDNPYLATLIWGGEAAENKWE